MDKIKYLLIALLLSFASISNAAIIDISNTNTEYASGMFSDLQGLQWLSLEQTQGQSRESIESGFGNYFSEGWRYATALETETLINSVWGGNYSGYSQDNASGAKWLIDVFSSGALTPAHVQSGSYSNGASFFDYSGRSQIQFIYGYENDCSFDINRSCYGVSVYAEEFTSSMHDPLDIHTNQQISGLFLNPSSVGYFDDLRGLNIGQYDRSANSGQPILDNNVVFQNVGHLLVRSVPEPSIIVLFGAGIIGLGLVRRRKQYLS